MRAEHHSSEIGRRGDIALVVAAAENGVIGRGGEMPWRLPTDLAHFKALTLGKPVVMGRKTFESIGRPLPGRLNIVVTRNLDWQRDGVSVAHTLDSALELARSEDASEICIIGGGELYRQAMPFADTIHLTRVEAAPEGDTTFPLPDKAEWRMDDETRVPARKGDSADMRFEVWKRR